MNALPSGPLVRIIPPAKQLLENNFPHFFVSKKGYLSLSVTTFLHMALFIGKQRDMQQNNNYRVKRRMPDEQRRKISEALRGRKVSAETKKALSRALSRYWKSVKWTDIVQEGE